MQVRMYSKAERERLHPEGVDMRFGGGTHIMPPEAADRLAFGLVKRDHATGKWLRVQLAPVDERILIEGARDRERSEAAAVADRDRPTGNRLR